MKVLPKDRLNYIHERLQDERFPIASIIKQTGFDRGNVSKMYNGKIPISEAFWEKFIEAYGAKKIPLTQETEIIKLLKEILSILKKEERNKGLVKRLTKKL